MHLDRWLSPEIVLKVRSKLLDAQSKFWPWTKVAEYISRAGVRHAVHQNQLLELRLD